MRALLSAAQQARGAGPGYLAVLLSACGQSDAVPPPRGLADPLTDRELEVLRLIAAGRSNQRIAHDLVVALDTVKKHVSHVLGKLGAANRTEAAARARQLGLECCRDLPQNRRAARRGRWRCAGGHLAAGVLLHSRPQDHLAAERL